MVTVDGMNAKPGTTRAASHDPDANAGRRRVSCAQFAEHAAVPRSAVAH
jgi:hypothetical protein